MIAEELAAVGVLSARGGPLSRHHVHAIVTYPFYRGLIVWKDLTAQGQHPSLVSDELFSRVQDAMRRRTLPLGSIGSWDFHREAWRAAPLATGGMTAERTKKKYGYYRCCRQQYQPELCRARYYRADDLHAQPDDLCRDLLTANVGVRDLMLRAPDPRTVPARRMVFESFTIAREGILDSALRA